MMKEKLLLKLLFLLLALPTVNCTFGRTFNSDTENEYSVTNIPLELILNANAIVRKNHTTFEVHDDGYAVKKVTFAATIFKRYENHYGELVLNYDDNLIEVENLDGILYDANGEEIRDLDDNDIEDYSAYKGYTLFDENRVKLVNLYYDKYPYTVEFTYEIGYNGFINWPSWYSQTTVDPVESSRFEVILHNNEELRYWCNADSIQPKITKDGETRTYVWEASNLAEMSVDIQKSNLIDFTTLVKVAPSTFEIDGYSGSMKSWKDFGMWFNDLSKGRSELPLEAKKKILKVVEGDETDIQKIEKLYKYMQSKVRYVNVTLGIGGWQPFDANYVYERGYGDCKALSNYMISLLKIVDIPGYPVLIKSGHYRTKIIDEFPSNQFNHVIVCVPVEQDTIWLECTSQTREAGSIGWSNENRGALMITPEGGVLVKTPISTSKKNLQVKNIDIDFSGNTAEVNSSIHWEGEQFNRVNSVFDERDYEAEEKWIKSLLAVPKITLNDYKFNKSNVEEATLSLNLTLSRYANQSGKRIFFKPNLMERNYYVPDKNEERVSPIRFRYPFLDIDTVRYAIPAKYRVESLPEVVNLSTSFGEFNVDLKVVGDSLIQYTRLVEINDYTIPAEKYDEYRDFYSRIVESDRKQIVLIKK